MSDREISRMELMRALAQDADLNVDDPNSLTCMSHVSEHACGEDKRAMAGEVRKLRARLAAETAKREEAEAALEYSRDAIQGYADMTNRADADNVELRAELSSTRQKLEALEARNLEAEVRAVRNE